MRKLLLSAMAVTAAMFMLAIFMPQSAEALDPPGPLTMTNTGDSPHVVFDHAKHAKDKAGEGMKCTSCHPRVFAMKAGDTVAKHGELTMKKMEAGEFCGKCHNGDKAFDVKDKKTCKKCHSK